MTHLFPEMDEVPKHCQPLHAPPARALAKSDGPTTSKVAAKQAVARGSVEGDMKRILDLLKLRPCTSAELAKLTPKYTQRVSDLRAAGFVITAKRATSAATGGKVWLYFLEEPA